MENTLTSVQTRPGLVDFVRTIRDARRKEKVDAEKAAELELTRRKNWVDYHLNHLQEPLTELPMHSVDISSLYGLRLSKLFSSANSSMNILGCGEEGLEGQNDLTIFLDALVLGSDIEEGCLGKSTYDISGLEKGKTGLRGLFAPTKKLARVVYRRAPVYNQTEIVELYDNSMKDNVQMNIDCLNKKTGLNFGIGWDF